MKKIICLIIFLLVSCISFCDIWSDGGTFNSSQIIQSDITIPSEKEVIIKGDLIICNSATLTVNGKLTVEGNIETTRQTGWNPRTYGNIVVSKNGVLRVKNDLTISVNSTIHLKNGSILVVERDLIQDGAFDLSRDVGDLNANGATIVVGRDYIIDISILGVDKNSKYPNASNNSVYIFGENNLDRINGTDSNKIKSGETFINEYGSISSFLPIELVSFSFEDNTFFWETASETNNDYFVVEYSRNGKDWTECTEHIPSASDYGYSYSTSPTTDVIASVFSYFRLKQVDLNGDYSYSDVIVSENKVCEPCSEKYEANKLKVKELGNRWFRNINGELIYCEGDNK